jgi:hypothetical protein
MIPTVEVIIVRLRLVCTTFAFCRWNEPLEVYKPFEEGSIPRQIQ